MPCDRVLKPEQTLAQRADELRKRAATIEKMIAANEIRVVIGRAGAGRGAITFTQPNGQPLAAAIRDGMADDCIYRRMKASTDSRVRQAIMRAQQVAGVSVDENKMKAGFHSHDGGGSWHPRG